MWPVLVFLKEMIALWCKLHWALYQENLNVHWIIFFLSWWYYSRLWFNWTEWYIYTYIYIDDNYTKMLRAILNKSWRQHPTIHQLYGNLPPITKTIQVRRTRHAGHCWRSRDELISDVLLWTQIHGRAKADDQHEHTFSNYLRIRDIVLKTCLGRWTIGKSGERGSGISVLPARHDDDDDI